MGDRQPAIILKQKDIENAMHGPVLPDFGGSVAPHVIRRAQQRRDLFPAQSEKLVRVVIDRFGNGIRRGTGFLTGCRLNNLFFGFDIYPG